METFLEPRSNGFRNVCMYVGMYDKGTPKRSVFTMVGHLRVLPHTKEQKTSPNGLQEYVFMEVLAGSRFEVFEVHPSIHPSVHTLDIYRGFRKRLIFTVVFENTQCSTYVKPDLLDIYRRFETYTENCPLKKL